MENEVKNTTENRKQEFLAKHGIWLMVLGLVAIIFILKYILIFFES